MRIGLVSGDGVPVSGLLTTFRNAVEVGRTMGVLEMPIPGDLGFSWRPDKSRHFPSGDAKIIYPDWMIIADCPSAIRQASSKLARELTTIREQVARFSSLSTLAKKQGQLQIAEQTKVYYRHFSQWLHKHDPDWVFAMNMILPDSVTATAALYQAVRDRFSQGRKGGILFWDHDLFQSAAIQDPTSGVRVYPERPNAWTPLPRKNSFTRWIVVSEALAEETSHYPTDLLPRVVPNVLPSVQVGTLEEHHRAFLRQLKLDLRRPLLLNPVRVVRGKGVHVALRLLASLKEQAERKGCEIPSLLVFGTLQEDPEYSQEVLALARALDVLADVHFLDGVPITTHYCDDSGLWKLDEIDLLKVSAASCGGIVFTPEVPNVETVGLGPGLGAMAGLPCAATGYHAFQEFYGSSFLSTCVDISPAGIARAGEEFLNVLLCVKRQDPNILCRLRENQRLVEIRFPVEPWRKVWRELEIALA